MTFPVAVLVAAISTSRDDASVAVAKVVEAAFEQPVKDRRFSGVVLVAKEGRPLFRKAYGFADWATQTANTPETPFMIFSVTKQFTAAAILRLQDQGLLSTSDLVSKHVADWPMEWNAVTLHHLLSHSAGIDVDALYFWLIKHHPRFWEDPKLTPPKYEPKPLLAEPGKVFRYSNAGYSVLSLVVERVTKTPFGQALKAEVFAPLGMARTQCEGAAPVPGRARGHVLTPTSFEIAEQKTHFIVGAGDVVSTVDDLLKWDDALRGDRFLSVTARASMFTPQVRGKRGGMGYSWQIRDDADPIHLFGGAGAGFRSLVIRKPSQGLFIAILGNCESPLDAEFAVKLLGDVGKALP